jgi:hypothetical protein
MDSVAPPRGSRLKNTCGYVVDTLDEFRKFSLEIFRADNEARTDAGERVRRVMRRMMRRVGRGLERGLERRFAGTPKLL